MNTPNTLKAYHNDPAVKREYLSRVMAHARADEIEKGHYWEGGKGCAVGCTIHGNDHSKYETALGIPQALAKLEDCIFEGLQNGEAKKFPAAFLRSIKPGVDLSGVTPRFLLAVQKHNLARLKRGKQRDEACENAIEQVIAVLLGWVKTGKADESAAESAAESAWSAAWSAARSAAWSAAESAAWSAAESAAESAAWSAARSAAWSAARSAAWSAARSAAESARSAAWSAEYSWMAKTLLKLLREAV